MYQESISVFTNLYIFSTVLFFFSIVLFSNSFGQDIYTQTVDLLSTFSLDSIPQITGLSTTETEMQTREVFTGRWSVFNDPMLDPRLIPDDPEQREGLRVTLLVSTWAPYDLDGNIAYIIKVNKQKLKEYYYREHRAKDGYITLCTGVMCGSHKIFICYNTSQEKIDKYATYQTFDFVMENLKEAFLTDMIIMPLVFIFGVFGKMFQNFSHTYLHRDTWED